MEVSTARVAQYKRILRETAHSLGVKQSSEAAQTAATLKMTATMMREACQMKLMSGQLIAPDALIKLETSLRELIPAAAERPMPVSVNIVPSRLCPRCRAEMSAEPKPPVMALSVPSPDAAQPEERMGNDPAAKETTSKPTNVVPIDKNRSRDFHKGQTALKTDIAHDPMMGGFKQDASARDPHPVDQTWPTPRGER